MKNAVWFFMFLLLTLSAGSGGAEAPAAKAPEGVLRACSYSSSGDMNGNVYTAALRENDSGALTLTVRESPAFNIPILVTTYRADSDALDRMRGIIDRYGMNTWSDLPIDESMIALDAPSTGITMEYDPAEKGGSREWCSVSYDAKLPENGWEALRAFKDCLFQWETADRLTEAYYETMDGVRVGELPGAPDSGETEALKRLFWSYAFTGTVGEGTPFTYEGRLRIRGEECYVFSVETDPVTRFAIAEDGYDVLIKEGSGRWTPED